MKSAYQAMWEYYLARQGRCHFFGIDVAIGAAISAAITAAMNAAASVSAAAVAGLGTFAAAPGAVVSTGTAGVVGGTTISAGALPTVAGTGLAGMIQGAVPMMAGLGTTIAQGGMVAGLGAAASAGTSIYTGYAQARQEKAMGKAQSRFAEYNAQVSEAQASAERGAGAAALRDARSRGVDIREKHRYLKAAQQTKMAKSGVIAASGTPLLVAQEEAMQGKLNVMDEIWKGKMEKRQHDIQAGFFDAQAAGSRMEGAFAKKLGKQRAKSSIISGWTKAGASLLSYGGSQYATMGQQGNTPMDNF